MEGFDLSAAKPVAEREDEGQVVHIESADGVPLYLDDKPVTVTVVGTYSSRYRRTEEAQANRRLKQRRAKLSASSLRDDRIALAVGCVIDWYGFTEEGKKLDPTPANVEKVFRAAPWVMEQVEAAMEDHAGFLRASSPS